MNEYNSDNATILNFINEIDSKKVWNNKVFDNHYSFNKNRYNSMKDHYSSINPKVIYQTAIVLPFHVPFDYKSITLPFFSFREKARTTIELMFSPVTDKITFTGGFNPKKGVKYNRKKTRCEIIVLFLEDKFVENGKFHSLLDLTDEFFYQNCSGNRNTTISLIFFQLARQILESAMELINTFLLTYCREQNDSTIRSVNIEELENVSHFRIIEPNDWKCHNWMTLNNENFPDNKKTISNELFQSISSSVVTDHNSYYESFFDYYQKALFESNAGNLESSIIHMVVSIEVFIMKIIKLYSLKIDRKTEDETIAYIEDSTFKNMMDKILPSIIGGSWDLSETSKSLPAKWYQNTYKLRSKVIHAGYTPLKQDINAAIENTSQLQNYIVDLMLKKRKQLKPVIDGFRSPFFLERI